MGKIYKRTTNEWPTSNNIFAQWAETVKWERFSLFFLFGWGVLGFASWCSVPQSLGHVQNAHSAELFWLAYFMPFLRRWCLCYAAYALHKSIDNPPMVVKAWPPSPLKKKVGKKQIIWERKVSNRQVWYWCNQCIPTSQKRKTERIVQWDVRTYFVFVTLVQSKPSRDRVKYNIQFYTFPPVG